MVAAKYEFTINFAACRASPIRSGTMTADGAQGSTSCTPSSSASNAWGTKHVRLTCNYLFNYFDGDAKNMKSNFFLSAREHELLFRLASPVDGHRLPETFARHATNRATGESPPRGLRG